MPKVIITKDNKIVQAVDSPTESCLGCDLELGYQLNGPCPSVFMAGYDCEGIIWQDVKTSVEI